MSRDIGLFRMECDASMNTEYIGMYEMMYKIRVVEEKVAEMVRSGEIKHRFVHFHDGEEAVAVGVINALRPDDVVMSHHRAHAHYIAKGGNLVKFFGELLGKRGCSYGYGGSMHLIDMSVRYYGSSSIVGGVIPLATGVGFAKKIKESDEIVTVFFGDGATNEGVFYECLNVAGLYGLPILFVVENNGYADHTKLENSRANPIISEVAEAIGVEAYDIFGNDVVKVNALVRKVVDKVREGEPVLIEANTVRYRGHVGCDVDYDIWDRKHSLRIWKEFDPIMIMRNVYLNSVDVSDVEYKVKEEVEEAYEKAHELPDAEVLWND